MANKFCVSLTHAKDNSDKATVGFVIANAALGSGKETLVFLSIEGVRLAQKGYAEDIREEGFAPLRELMDNFAKARGTIYVCSPCFKKRKLDENNLVAAPRSWEGPSWWSSSPTAALASATEEPPRVSVRPRASARGRSRTRGPGGRTARSGRAASRPAVRPRGSTGRCPGG